MKEIHESDLELVTGGVDVEEEEQVAWACGFAPSENGGWDMVCVGPYGDDVMDNAGICNDDSVPCFI